MNHSDSVVRTLLRSALRFHRHKHLSKLPGPPNISRAAYVVLNAAAWSRWELAPVGLSIAFEEVLRVLPSESPVREVLVPALEYYESGRPLKGGPLPDFGGVYNEIWRPEFTRRRGQYVLTCLTHDWLVLVRADVTTLLHDLLLHEPVDQAAVGAIVAERLVNEYVPLLEAEHGAKAAQALAELLE